MVSKRPELDEIWLVSLGPAVGSEIRKSRPCLIISPNEMNFHLRTVIVAPMTTVERPYPTRIPVAFQGRRGQVALDQLRAVDRARLVKRLGAVSSKTAHAVSDCLIEMFTRKDPLSGAR